MYRYLSSIKSQREAAEKFYADLGMSGPKAMGVDKQQLISDVRNALYASKICSYAQVQPLPPPEASKPRLDLHLPGGFMYRCYGVSAYI